MPAQLESFAARGTFGRGQVGAAGLYETRRVGNALGLSGSERPLPVRPA